MNNTRIQVRTGVGNTKKAEIGFVIGQGTIGGALASQASLDDGIDGQFFGSQEELKYEAVPMSPCFSKMIFWKGLQVFWKQDQQI